MSNQKRCCVPRAHKPALEACFTNGAALGIGVGFMA
jgi:hypothetical protein